ncbi:uncharacterized protein LOC122456393 isoform X2 [Dermochelys coriacea]|uniref:uncharacterized protein LOC122456393 isoform X2 n=1 Tax=Dermochelys coriacea TaxID=27794 RepID=UPI001CA9CA8E|nr:uncharacterized protein LOC122456393 isoform X2 [Dermochelys coriacea]
MRTTIPSGWGRAAAAVISLVPVESVCRSFLSQAASARARRPCRRPRPHARGARAVPVSGRVRTRGARAPTLSQAASALAGRARADPVRGRVRTRGARARRPCHRRRPHSRAARADPVTGRVRTRGARAPTLSQAASTLAGRARAVPVTGGVPVSGRVLTRGARAPTLSQAASALAGRARRPCLRPRPHVKRDSAGAAVLPCRRSQQPSVGFSPRRRKSTFLVPGQRYKFSLKFTASNSLHKG